MKQITLIALIAILLGFQIAESETITVTDESIMPGENVKWTSDNEYILDGFVFVEDGSSLTIEPGTVVKGKSGSGANASALIVARGGKIYAEGTYNNPIVFTSEFDDVNNPNDLTHADKGLWGGVVILGRSTINVAGGEEQIEGIPVEEPRGAYGGDNESDNSGVFKYVSIRHGGSVIGQDNELNGLTLGAVGSGTTVEYVEIFANLDDGIEWFGGTVNTKYLISAFCGDDGFDYDEGFRGKGQFWFTIMDPDDAGSAGEHDGGTSPEDGQPYSQPMIYNATYIGPGTNTGNLDVFINIRDNAGAHYYSSIFTEGSGDALSIEDLDGSGEDSRKRMEAGELIFSNNIFYNFGGTLSTQSYTVDHLNANNNREVNPELNAIARESNGVLDPRISQGSPAWTGAKAAPEDGFFTPVDYVGAFGNTNWAASWTFIGEAEYISSEGAGNPASVKLTEGSLTGSYNNIFVSPNPVEEYTEIIFNNTQTSNVQVDIVDQLGNKVANLLNKNLNKGSYTLLWTPENVQRGMYFIVLNTEYGTFSKKIIVK